VAANIFNGKITTWNDPAIAAINPGVTLPSTPIKVFFRSDESGTTENFTKYLSAAAPADWTAAPGKKWTGKGEGKEKSAGVASAVQSTDGGITYVEWSYAKDNKLGMAQIDNGAGAVELTGDSVGKAVAAAKVVGQGNDLSLKLDYTTKEPGAYPILLVTYEIVCSKAKDASKVDLLKAFLTHFASADTQKTLEGIGYAPLPADLQAKVNSSIAALS
jgi:phosphate transport system substrate-binding protein